MWLLYVLAFVAAGVMAIVLTPFVKKFALWIGAVDTPNQRKVHHGVMPRLGGLAIYLSFVGAYFIIAPAMDGNTDVALGLLLGGSVIVLTGALDDKFGLSPKMKLLGQTMAAAIVVAFGLRVNLINLPFGEAIDVSWISVPLTMLWIVGVTNAINLIDGLDGLAAGVSGIATITITILAVMMGNTTVVLISLVLLGSIVGFLFYNFHPAKIFMGDTGALFLGFSLATLSILGFKQATFVSFVIPMLILGVPLSDTLFAVIRRILNRKPISVADKGHLHHCLLQLGFSHRATVLMIYAVAGFFGLCAILLSQATLWVTIIGIVVLLVAIEVGAEAIGIISKKKKPILDFLAKFKVKESRTDSRS